VARAGGSQETLTEAFGAIQAVVVGWEQFNPDRNRLFTLLNDEMRLAKAGALYADQVTLASQATTIALQVLDETVEDEDSDVERIGGLLSSLNDEAGAGLVALTDALNRGPLVYPGRFGTAILVAKWVDGLLPPDYLPLTSQRSVRAIDPITFNRNYAEFARSPDGLQRLEEIEAMAATADDEWLREQLEEFIAEERLIRGGAEPRLDDGPPAAPT
jgi:hypothetical protein